MANKIFIDLDEEIIFAVEKVLASDGNQVILIVPESSQLVSSLVSLKLLARQIYKSNKIVILVSEDKLGLELSKEASLVAVEKISDVTGETWKDALRLKEQFIEARENLKHELVSKREEGEKVKLEEEETEGKKENRKPKKEEETDGEDDDNFFEGQPEKPRLGGKKVDIEGFAMIAGGDIREHKELLVGDSAEDKEKSESLNSKQIRKSKPEKKLTQDSELKTQNPKEDKKAKHKVSATGASYLGRDLSALKGAKSKSRLGGGRFAFLDTIKTFLNKSKNTKYFVLAGLTLVILFLLGYFVLPEATIEITLAEAAVPVNEDVRADLTATSVDVEGLTVPARKVELKKSKSDSAITTGTGEDGDIAKGLVDFFNKSDNSISLKAGTVLNPLGDSSRKYTVTKAVVVPPSPGGLGLLENVEIAAEKFGDEYNINGSKDFVVAGFDPDTELLAKSFRDITGGTTEEVVQVSKEDFNDLKDSLTEGLQATLFAELDGLIEGGEMKLEGTEQSTEPKVTPSHNIDDQTESLDMTVEITASIFVVSEKDLTQLANHLIENKQKLEGEFEIQDIDELRIDGAFLNGNIATFNLRVEGNIKGSIDEQAVKDAIKGKDYAKAANIVRDLPDVDEFTLKFTPQWMPIKRMPTDVEKITVTFK